MPKVRFVGAGEGEEVGQMSGASTTRMLNNFQLADYMGKFIAGELATTFKNEDVNSIVKRLDMNALRLSWG